MSNLKKVNLPRLFRSIAEKLEATPTFLSDLEKFIENYPAETTAKKELIDIDIWQLFEKGSGEFEKAMADLSIPQLIHIIRKNNLDASKLSHKWKSKEKLVELIKSRTEERKNKGAIFLGYDVQKANLLVYR